MKKFTNLLFCLIILSCSKVKQIENYKEYKIEFLNWKLKVPENYYSVTLEKYGDIVKKNYKDSILIENKILHIEKLKNQFSAYVMFYNKYNFENTITIIGMPNPKPNKIVKNQVAQIIHSDLKEKGKSEKFTYKPMENRLINDWLIKVKGQKTYTELGVTIYQTNYLASNFGAYVFNTNKNFDFEKELTE